MLKLACSLLMTGSPRASSTPTPRAFIETSMAAVAQPGQSCGSGGNRQGGGESQEHDPTDEKGGRWQCDAPGATAVGQPAPDLHGHHRRRSQ